MQLHFGGFRYVRSSHLFIGGTDSNYDLCYLCRRLYFTYWSNRSYRRRIFKSDNRQHFNWRKRTLARLFFATVRRPEEGRFRGRDAVFGPTSGDWTVNGSLMCWHFDKVTIVHYNDCFTTNLDRDTVTWYLASGTLRYSRAGRIGLISRNPDNL